MKTGKSKYTSAVFFGDTVFIVFFGMRIIAREKNKHTNIHEEKTVFEHVFLSKVFDIISISLLVVLYLSFIVRHFVAYQRGASMVFLLFIALESVLIILFLFRRPAIAQTADIQPWFYALAGTYISLTFSPTGVILSSELSTLSMFIGCILVLATYLSLNRSFGIGPALRDVKTSGLYHFIRHPMYASYLFIYLGYILTSFSFINLILMIVVCFSQVKRALYEEHLLQTSDEYTSYMKKVPWRFIPGIV